MIPLDTDENSVGLIGDTEGNMPWTWHRITKFAEADIRTVLHLGDLRFGVGSERPAKARLLRLTGWLEEHEQTWLVTPGNHENWDRLTAKKPGADGLQWFSERVAFIPRGHRWAWKDINFVSLGGAPSVNRANLREGSEWWPGEQITTADVDAVVAGGRADVMLTHDAPEPLTPAVQSILDRNHQGWSQDALAYAAEGRAQMTRAFEAVQPRLLVHGHYHVYDRARIWLEGAPDPTDLVSLAADEMPRNAAILDLDEGLDGLRVTTT